MVLLKMCEFQHLIREYQYTLAFLTFTKHKKRCNLFLLSSFCDVDDFSVYFIYTLFHFFLYRLFIQKVFNETEKKKKKSL